MVGIGDLLQPVIEKREEADSSNQRKAHASSPYSEEPVSVGVLHLAHPSIYELVTRNS